jgi:two-component system NtrC family sensor kinase
VVIVRRRQDWRGAQRLFWDTFLLGLVLWLIGHAGWVFTQQVLQRPGWVQWHTIFSLCGATAPLIALLARPQRGVRAESTAAISVDLASYGMLAGFLYAYIILVPAAEAPAPVRDGALLAIVNIERVVLAAAMVAAAVAARRTAWGRIYVRLASGACAGLVLRQFTNMAIVRGTYHIGTVYDLTWIIPFLCVVWAAADAPSSPRSDYAVTLEAPGGSPPAVVSAIPVLLIPALGFGLLHSSSLGPTGESFRILLTTLATVGGLGLLTLRLGVQRDELHRADARIRLLAAATEQTADLILITRANGAVEHANHACVGALGYSRSELVGMGLRDLLDHGFSEMVDRIGTEVRQSGSWRGTLVHRRKDGTAFPASSTVVALRGADGRVTHFVGVQRDITEELRLRDQLVHSERLSAVGELVAGVAHEINNPLQTIVGCVELLQDDGSATEQQLRDFALVRREAARAGQIVRNLLSFIRRGSPERGPTDLNQIVRATAELREYHLVQRNIALEVDLAPGSLNLLANRDEIQQVVLNLVLNAEQAIAGAAGSGTIRLRTRTEGTSHVLEVEDDGPGVSEELRGRIFEPFFTTKDVGEGTGLGLSISHGIARSHGGALELVGEGKGACFRLTLPAHQTPAAPASSAAAPRPSNVRRALVIDDEPPILTLLSRLLERRGYSVVTASSAEEAETRLGRGPFSIVLCDVRMQGTGGLGFLRWLRERDPALARRMVFITGDEASLAEDDDASRDVPVLVKPFSAADLDRALAALDPLPVR